jgi:hypothetical protein
VVRASVLPLAAIAGISPGGWCSRLLGIPPDVRGAAVDNPLSDWIGCRGGIWGTTGADGDAEGAPDVGHRAVDRDTELRVPEIGPDGIKDRKGDVPVEAELVDCGGAGALPLDQADEGHNDAPVRCVESDHPLTVDRLWQKWRELTAKSSGRNPNRSPRKALRVIG